MRQLVLFDLGDTLLFKSRPLIDFDIDLLHKISKLEKSKIKHSIEKFLINYPGIYNFSVDPVLNMSEEDDKSDMFFSEVFLDLGISKKPLVDFALERKRESRYQLFPGTVQLLESLKEGGFTMGIISNGRPSRRRLMSQLGIEKYFDLDLVYISDELGMAKPDYEIYQYINEKSGYKYISICDDEERNLKVPELLNWNIIKVDHKNFGYKNVYKKLLEK